MSRVCRALHSCRGTCVQGMQGPPQLQGHMCPGYAGPSTAAGAHVSRVCRALHSCRGTCVQGMQGPPQLQGHMCPGYAGPSTGVHVSRVCRALHSCRGTCVQGMQGPPQGYMCPGYAGPSTGGWGGHHDTAMAMINTMTQEWLWWPSVEDNIPKLS